VAEAAAPPPSSLASQPADYKTLLSLPGVVKVQHKCSFDIRLVNISGKELYMNIDDAEFGFSTKSVADGANADFNMGAPNSARVHVFPSSDSTKRIADITISTVIAGFAPCDDHITAVEAVSSE
jgi:hypothetical protein